MELKPNNNVFCICLFILLKTVVCKYELTLFKHFSKHYLYILIFYGFSLIFKNLVFFQICNNFYIIHYK